MENLPKGYVIQLYQYALRYKYNNQQFLDYFNDQIDAESYNGNENEDFLVLGDFDLIEINEVASFRQFHDISNYAKNWIGKRQCMLLYDISDQNNPTRIHHVKEGGNSRNIGCWEKAEGESPSKQYDKKFFCLSMLALTNEISSSCKDIGKLLSELRKGILAIVDTVNKKENIDIICEVYGTFNTSELAVIWLCDEYVDILHMIEYIKHMSVLDSTSKNYTAFMTAFSVVAIKANLDLEHAYTMKGDALVQISFNDGAIGHKQQEELKKDLLEKCGIEPEKKGYDSVGEFDWIMKSPASAVFKLLNPHNSFNGLHIGKRAPEDGGRYDRDQRCRDIIRNNVRLLIASDINDDLVSELDNMMEKGQFCLLANCFEVVGDDSSDFKEALKNNRNKYYNSLKGIRKKLKEKINPSTGIVDTMDLLITDYQSVISSAYSKVWAEDIHRQFGAVLDVLDNLIVINKKEDFWDLYRDLTNAFKQQVYHLTQASRLFFEVPSSHLRATGHYDFLMHAYYGVTKKIIEAIYLMQGKDAQSELVPLLTINTEPQVKSELFFQYKKDSLRAMNLIIPNSVLTDPYRGIFYLCHEMFHYAVPQSRIQRNYHLGAFLLARIFRKQIFEIIRKMLSEDRPAEFKKTIDDWTDFTSYNSVIIFLAPIDKTIGFDQWLLEEILKKDIYTQFEESFDKDKNYIFKKDDLKDRYKMSVVKFAVSDKSNTLFNSLFQDALNYFKIRIEADSFQALFKNDVTVNSEDIKPSKDTHNNEENGEDTRTRAIKWIYDRLTYFIVLSEHGSDGKNDLNQYLELHQKSLLDYDEITYDNTGDISDAFQLSSALFEAYSDIAAITLTGTSFLDYFLFFIQNVSDINRDNSYNSEKFTSDEEFRLALVIDYCMKNIINNSFKDAYENYKNGHYLIHGKDLDYFKNAYLWTFLRHRSSVNPKEREVFESNACGWVHRLSSIYNKYISNYGCYIDDVFMPVLDSANVLKRIEALKGSSGIVEKKGCELEKIQILFKEAMQRYTNLNKEMINDIGFDLVKRESYLRLFFETDLLTIRLFQRQKSLYQLKDCNETIKELYQKSGEAEYDDVQYVQHTVPDEEEKSELAKDESGHSDDEADQGENVSKETLKSCKKCKKERRIKLGCKLDNEITVYSWEQLQYYLKICKAQFEAEIENRIGRNSIYSQIWYRGHSTVDHSLLPTAYRTIHKKEKVRKIYKTVCGYQRSQFEYFKTLTDGASEIPFYGDFSKADYVALMQHYGLDTNLLDFTDNAFISLYLALKYYSKEELKDAEKYFIEDEIKDFTEKKQKDVVLYLFSPALYNTFRRKTILDSINSDISDESMRAATAKMYGVETKHTLYGMIPNVSIPHNEKLYSRYIFGDEGLDDEFLGGNLLKPGIPALPIAMWTPRLNNRIRTQSGSFVAFDLYEDFNNLENSLELIQCSELTDKEKTDSPCIFLYKIIIDKHACKEIYNALNTMGMTRQFVYPEIEQVKYRF